CASATCRRTSSTSCAASTAVTASRCARTARSARRRTSSSRPTSGSARPCSRRKSSRSRGAGSHRSGSRSTATRTRAHRRSARPARRAGARKGHASDPPPVTIRVRADAKKSRGEKQLPVDRHGELLTKAHLGDESADRLECDEYGAHAGVLHSNGPEGVADREGSCDNRNRRVACVDASGEDLLAYRASYPA